MSLSEKWTKTGFLLDFLHTSSYQHSYWMPPNIYKMIWLGNPKFDSFHKFTHCGCYSTIILPSNWNLYLKWQFFLKVIVKSDLKNIFEITSCGKYVFCCYLVFEVLDKNLTIYEVGGNNFQHEGVSKILFLDQFSLSFLGQKF